VLLPLGRKQHFCVQGHGVEFWLPRLNLLVIWTIETCVGIAETVGPDFGASRSNRGIHAYAFGTCMEMDGCPTVGPAEQNGPGNKDHGPGTCAYAGQPARGIRISSHCRPPPSPRRCAGSSCSRKEESRRDAASEGIRWEKSWSSCRFLGWSCARRGVAGGGGGGKKRAQPRRRQIRKCSSSWIL
jgi:hypothetical protein